MYYSPTFTVSSLTYSSTFTISGRALSIIDNFAYVTHEDFGKRKTIDRTLSHYSPQPLIKGFSPTCSLSCGLDLNKFLTTKPHPSPNVVYHIILEVFPFPTAGALSHFPNCQCHATFFALEHSIVQCR